MQDQLWNAGQIRITTGRGWRYGSQAGYCREPGCTNRARAKQGARYCEYHARSIDYGPLNTDNATFKESLACGGCGTAFNRWRGSTTEAWNHFCRDCHEASPLSRTQLKAHNVPYALAQEWLALGAELRCGLCERRMDRRSMSGAPTIDHGHDCCPGQRSCGECIRGVLCTQCNTCIGAYERLVARVGFQNVLGYLS